jgi:ABC-type multidrug transport system fused ATPase/permease subunit
VISFATEDAEQTKYSDRINEQYMLNIRQIFMTGIYYMFISTFLINTVVQGTLPLVGSYMIQHGDLTSEVLLAFMLYQGQLQNEMMNLFNSFTSLIKSSGAGDKVFELLDRSPPPPATGSETMSRANLHPANDSPVSIQLENVHFSYPTRKECPVLKGINLNIKAGSTVALVGPSGCGKSSIVNLLQRYYDPISGVISFDGINVKEFDVKLHRRRIGIVTQDPVLFSGTILSNITYGMPNATREQAIEAAKRANAHEFITAMPDGYETEVGERGLKLSGGQRQRIAISRAIIRHPSLLLLDEATSALDAESEEVVQRSIDALLKESTGITTIVIAHRLQTVRNADVIACVNDGKIVEMGSHQELMRLDGGYYKIMVSKSMEGKLVTD